MENSKDKPDELTSTKMIGHVIIREVETGKVLLNQRDGATFQKTLRVDNGR